MIIFLLIRFILGSSHFKVSGDNMGVEVDPFHLSFPKASGQAPVQHKEAKESLFLNALKEERDNGWLSFVFESRR